MSFAKTIEGDVEKVVKELEDAFKSAGTKAEAAVHEFVGYMAQELRTIAGSGKKLVLSVESAGHFNDDGTGNVAIKVTSAEAPKEAQTEPAAAAPETPPAAEPETPPEEAPAGKQPE